MQSQRSPTNRRRRLFASLLLITLAHGQLRASVAASADSLQTNTVSVPAAGLGAAAAPPASVRQHWADRVRLFAAQSVPAHPVVLLGDSLTEGFDVARYFPGHPVVNRGISSDVIGNGLASDDNRGVLRRLDGSVFPSQARDVFILIGVNDLGDRHALDQMELGYRELMQRLRAAAPEAHLHVESLLPARGHYARLNENIRLFNERLRLLAAEYHAEYLDLHALLLDEQGELKAECSRDGLHLNERGYQIWQAAIDPSMGWH